MKNFKNLGLAIIPASGLAVASTLLFTAPSLALNYTWDVNLSQNGYSATGYIITDTNAANTALGASNIIDWSYTLTNLSTSVSDTLNSSNSSKGYSAGLVINSTSNALIMAQNSAFGALDSVSTTSGTPTSKLYFGYPFTSGSIPNLYIQVNGGGSTPGSFSSGSNLYTTNVFATPSAAVPFDIPGGATIPVAGSLLALGAMRKVKKTIALKTRIAETAVS
ncbi:hypothetical protein [Trichormus variabilis]|uniref:PEP-CTERM protein-sorting domain-containing protein n=1 Tax=Trichormus variabilis SAG 1403-4b TaxID=447716 RepID=A0A433UVS9_ANAVA|nr:hypothetical protein [Trichormus variabilis]MBD2627655.1 hypothetical protein [Trichormus variabilis FACHB-164]RUS97887.1 hypothetical protein DSM107003_17620 [Trichormus variabilis SAG 1403-4b]